MPDNTLSSSISEKKFLISEILNDATLSNTTSDAELLVLLENKIKSFKKSSNDTISIYSTSTKDSISLLEADKKDLATMVLQLYKTFFKGTSISLTVMLLITHISDTNNILDYPLSDSDLLSLILKLIDKFKEYKNSPTENLENEIYSLIAIAIASLLSPSSENTWIKNFLNRVYLYARATFYAVKFYVNRV